MRDRNLVYLKDVTFDKQDNPIDFIPALKTLQARTHEQEPSRSWNIARWTGSEWLHHKVCDGYHNYDLGSLYIEDEIPFESSHPRSRPGHKSGEQAGKSPFGSAPIKVQPGIKLTNSPATAHLTTAM